MAWKHLCQSLLFIKITSFSPATLLKKRLWDRCFPVNFAKFLRTPFFLEHLRWLLLCNSTEYEWTQMHSSQIFIIASRIVVMRNSSIFRTVIFHNSCLQEQPPKVFYKKAVCKNFAIFIGKYLFWSFFLIKLQSLRAILKNICERLLLYLTDFSEQLVTVTQSKINILYECYPWQRK